MSSLLGGALGGSTIGAAIVKLELDSAKYQAELKAAQAQTGTATTGMGNAMATFGGLAKAGAGVAAVAVGAFAVNAVRAASDLGEAINKSNVVFGNQARQMESWAETGAQAFGLSKTAALDAAAGFGQMLQTAGLAVRQSANMSQALVKLAGDMASFNNIDPTEALEKLRSGLAGEAEPLRRFGVFLSEAAVQAKAMELGIGDASGELTEAQKVQARYAIILEQTTKQQNDFARTADSLPNQIRSLRAEFENVSADVGEALLPVMTDLLELVRALVPALRVFADGLAIAADHVGVLAGPVGLVVDVLGESGFKGEVAALRKEVRPAAKEIVRFGQAIAEDTVPAVEKFIGPMLEAAGNMGKMGKKADQTRKDVVKFAHMTGAELDEWRTEIKGSFDAFIFSLEESAEQTVITRKEFKDATRLMQREARQLATAMAKISKEKWVNEEYIAFLSEQGPEWLIGFSHLTESEQRKAQNAWERSTDKTNKAKRSLDGISGALDRIADGRSKHTIELHYEYKGFDPSKPGMGGPQ